MKKFLAHKSPSKESWTNFEKIRKLTTKIKDTKVFYKKVLTSKNTKEIWQMVHCFLKPNEKTQEPIQIFQ